MLLKNLLKASPNDKLLYSQLNFDFEDKNNADKKLNVEKVIGMFNVYKFFKPFLDKCFHSTQIEENIMEKITELNNEVLLMKAIFSFNV